MGECFFFQASNNDLMIKICHTMNISGSVFTLTPPLTSAIASLSY